MRADRLLSILLMLQARGEMTAGELARELEVSERTVYRDMDALSVAGIPVIAERGRGGGWALLEGYRTNLTGLNAAEIQAMLLNNPANLLADLGLEQAANDALLKVMAALPSTSRQSAEFFRERIYIDNGRWHNMQDDTPHLSALQDALWHEFRVRLSYERSDGQAVERLVDPLGLVAKGAIWYLVAAVGEDMRTYRVSRILDLHITDEPAQRPTDFDLAAYWIESRREFVATLPKYPATLRIHEGAKHLLTMWRWAKVEHLGPPDDAGWCEAHIAFEVIDEAAGSVLGGGGKIIVVEPEELRQRVIVMARGVLAVFEG